VGALADDEDHEVVGVADELHDRTTSAPVLGACPCRTQRRVLGGEVFIQHGQGDVGQQRGQDSSNAMGNFCFEVSLSYRRLERLPRVTGGK
jgi:hypothetical protein